MLPKWHILIGALTSLVIYLIFHIPIEFCIIIFLSSVLIDVDHYLYYVLEEKDLSLKRAYRWFVVRQCQWLKLSNKEKYKHRHLILIFHGIEFWFILFLLTYVNVIYWYIFFGIAIHMLADWIHLIYHGIPLYTKFSQIYTHLTNKDKKKFIHIMEDEEDA